MTFMEIAEIARICLIVKLADTLMGIAEIARICLICLILKLADDFDGNCLNCSDVLDLLNCEIGR